MEKTTQDKATLSMKKHTQLT